jgi:hypothetical protein
MRSIFPRFLSGLIELEDIWLTDGGLISGTLRPFHAAHLGSEESAFTSLHASQVFNQNGELAINNMLTLEPLTLVEGNGVAQVGLSIDDTLQVNEGKLSVRPIIRMNNANLDLRFRPPLNIAWDELEDPKDTYGGELYLNFSPNDFKVSEQKLESIEVTLKPLGALYMGGVTDIDFIDDLLNVDTGIPKLKLLKLKASDDFTQVGGTLRISQKGIVGSVPFYTLGGLDGDSSLYFNSIGRILNAPRIQMPPSFLLTPEDVPTVAYLDQYTQAFPDLSAIDVLPPSEGRRYLRVRCDPSSPVFIDAGVNGLDVHTDDITVSKKGGILQGVYKGDPDGDILIEAGVIRSAVSYLAPLVKTGNTVNLSVDEQTLAMLGGTLGANLGLGLIRSPTGITLNLDGGHGILVSAANEISALTDMVTLTFNAEGALQGNYRGGNHVTVTQNMINCDITAGAGLIMEGSIISLTKTELDKLDDIPEDIGDKLNDFDHLKDTLGDLSSVVQDISGIGKQIGISIGTSALTSAITSAVSAAAMGLAAQSAAQNIISSNAAAAIGAAGIFSGLFGLAGGVLGGTLGKKGSSNTYISYNSISNGMIKEKDGDEPDEYLYGFSICTGNQYSNTLYPNPQTAPCSVVPLLGASELQPCPSSSPYTGMLTVLGGCGVSQAIYAGGDIYMQSSLKVASESFVLGKSYITAAALGPYLLASTAASTYLSQTSAASTYLTQANASTLASKTYVDSNVSTLQTAINGKQASGDYATNTALNNGLSGKQGVLNLQSPLSMAIDGVTLRLDLSGYYTKGQIDSQLSPINIAIGGKESILTFSGLLTRNGNIIGVDLSTYALKSYVDGQVSGLNTSVAGKEVPLTFNAPLVRSLNSISIDLSAIYTRAQVDSTFATTSTVNSALAGKESVLTFSGLLTRNGNIIGLDLSSYYTKGQIDSQLSPINIAMGGKESILTFSAPLTRTSNTVSLNTGAITSVGTLSSLNVSGSIAAASLNVNSASTSQAIPMQVFAPSLTTNTWVVQRLGVAGTNFNSGQIVFGNVGPGSTANTLGFCLTGANQALTIDGNNTATFGGNLSVPSASFIHFGYNATKDANAGKMGYNVFSSNGLDIVGAGTSAPRILNVYEQICVNSTAFLGPPTFSTRSTGSKLVLYPAVSGSFTDYGIGMMSSSMWLGIPQNANNNYFRFYGGTTNIATLDGVGNLYLGSGNIPTGISTELGGSYTPIINLDANFHLNTNTSYLGAAFRIDLRGTTCFNWLSRPAGSSTESVVATMSSNGDFSVNALYLSGNQAITFSPGVMNFSSPGVINLNPSGAMVNVTKDLGVSGNITMGGLPIASQSWVSGQNYVTSAALTPYATQSWTTSNFLSSAPSDLTVSNQLNSLKVEINGGGNNIGGANTGWLSFQYYGGGYRHFIRSRHDAQTSSTGSALDFFLNSSTGGGGSTQPGTGNVNVMSVSSARVDMNKPLVINAQDNVSANWGDLTQTSGGALRVEGSSVFNAPVLITGLRNNLTFNYGTSQNWRYYNFNQDGWGTQGASVLNYAFVMGSNTRLLQLSGCEINQVSDRRSKKDVTDIEGALSIVNSISAKRFRYIDGDDSLKVGFIAQDCADLCPEVVSHMKAPNGDHSIMVMNTLGMLPYLWNSLKELSAVVQELAARVKDLQSTNKE